MKLHIRYALPLPPFITPPPLRHAADDAASQPPFAMFTLLIRHDALSADAEMPRYAAAAIRRLERWRHVSASHHCPLPPPPYAACYAMPSR